MFLSPVRRRLYYLWYRSGDWWVPELISISTSLVLFGVYYYLLLKFDGEKEDAWWTRGRFELPSFITLPSVIALLTTLMRAAIGFPVASAIGQLKWHRFRHRSRSLAEFDHFDNATRGMSGSLSFLLSSHFWSPASIGCIIILTGLLFGPFLQNTVKPMVGWRSVWTEEARIPVLRTFNRTNTLADSDISRDHFVTLPQVQAGIARGWFLDQSTEVITEDISGFLHTTCTASQCNWSRFSTLVLTSECKLSTVDDIDNDGLFPVATSEAAGLTSARQNSSGDRVQTNLNMEPSIIVPKKSVFADRQDGLAILAHVGILSNYMEDTFEAVECVLYWAAVRGEASYANGTLIENYSKQRTIPETRDFFFEEDFPDVIIRGNWSCGSNTSSEQDDYCDYTLTSDAQRGLFNSLSSYINGWVEPLHETETDIYSFAHSGDTIQALHWSWDKMNGSIEDVSRQYFENVAFAVTMALRMTSEEYSAGGYTLREEVIFDVRFEYVFLPLIFLAVSILFFFGVVIGTRKDPLWRNSQLPLLFHGLEDAGPREWEAVRLADMWRAADEMDVQMHGEQKSGDMRLRRSDVARAGDTELSGYQKVQGHVDIEEARS